MNLDYTAKVLLIMRLVLTPINWATWGFCAVARIARPSDVRFINIHNPVSVMAVISTIVIFTGVRVAPNTLILWDNLVL